MDSTFPPGLLPQGRDPGSPRDPAGARRRRPLFWLALAFCAGIAGDDLLAPARPALGGLFVTAALAALACLALLREQAWRGHARLAAALLAGLAGGAFTHAMHARFPLAHDVSRRTPPTPSLAWIEGVVTEVRRTEAGGVERERWTVELSALGASPDELSPASGRVQLAARSDASTAGVAEGRVLRVLARLESPASATLPEAFDQGAYLARLGIRRVGEPARGGTRVLGEAPWWRADLRLRRWSAALAER
ncbi:MAG: DUF4131 domain-containing protein, partial [Planctomycetota bacterium]|nr:DUF4131 domain-containing protein [Planctomycetota bacterium]